MDIRYGNQIDIDFTLLAPVRYGNQLDIDFILIDGFPPLIDDIYCTDVCGNPLNTLDTVFVVGSHNVYDTLTGLKRITFGYGLNDPSTPNSWTDIAPIEGTQEHLFEGFSFSPGDVLYHWIEAEDNAGNVLRTDTYNVIVEGIPVRYGNQLDVFFAITGDVILAESNATIMISPAEFPKRKLKVF